MNWKTTIGLGLLFLVSLGALMVMKPSEDGPDAIRPVFSAKDEDVSRIEIQMPGQAEILIRRQAQPVGGVSWMLAAPIQQPADEARVLEMLSGLRRLFREGGIPATDSRYNLASFGLEPPGLRVNVFVGEKKHSIRFGKVAAVDANLRYFMVDDDPAVYAGPGGVHEAFSRKITELRNRILARFEPSRVQELVLESRYLKTVLVMDDKGKMVPKKDKDGKPVQEPAYENSTFKLVELPGSPQGGMRGWYLVNVEGEEWGERVDQMRMAQLISELRSATVEEYVQGGDPAAYGLDKPETRYRFQVHQLGTLVFEFGKTEARGEHKIVWGRVNNSTEFVAISEGTYKRLGRTRADFRTTEIYDFNKDDIVTATIVSPTGKLKIGREEKEVKRGEETVKEVVWSILEPKGMPTERDIAEPAAERLLGAAVVSFCGRQPDLKTFGLDPPAITVTFDLKFKDASTKTVVYKFGSPGGTTAYLLKPNSTEIFEISELYWRSLERADLNVRSPTMFDVTRDSITRVAFDMKGDAQLRDLYWMVEKRDGKWIFVDKDHKDAGAKVSDSAMKELLNELNSIRAESFITRDLSEQAKYGLGGATSHGRLTIEWAPDPTRPNAVQVREIQISKPYPDRDRKMKLFYAKMIPRGDEAANPDFNTVFRMRREFMEKLTAGVVWEDAPDEGTNPPTPTPTPSPSPSPDAPPGPSKGPRDK